MRLGRFGRFGDVPKAAAGPPPQLIVMSSHRPAKDINANAVDIFAPWGMTAPAPSSFPQPQAVSAPTTGVTKSYKLGPPEPKKADTRVSDFVNVGAGISDLYTEYGFRSLSDEAEYLADQAQRQFETSAVTSFPGQSPIMEYAQPMPMMATAPGPQMIEESLTTSAPFPVAAMAPAADTKKDRTMLFLILGAIGVGALVAGMRGR